MTYTAEQLRVSGGQSLHEAEDVTKCPEGKHALWRTVACDGVTDVIECSRCGQQRTTSCTFDEDFS